MVKTLIWKDTGHFHLMSQHWFLLINKNILLLKANLQISKQKNYLPNSHHHITTTEGFSVPWRQQRALPGNLPSTKYYRIQFSRCNRSILCTSFYTEDKGLVENNLAWVPQQTRQTVCALATSQKWQWSAGTKITKSSMHGIELKAWVVVTI